MAECKLCGESFLKTRKDKVFCSRSCKDKYGYYKARSTFIEMYGGKCECCGEDFPPFLTVDHVENDGADKKRKHHSHHKKPRDANRGELYRAIQEYCPDEFQILCANCNGAKARFGFCPCQDKKIDIWEDHIKEHHGLDMPGT